MFIIIITNITNNFLLNLISFVLQAYSVSITMTIQNPGLGCGQPFEAVASSLGGTALSPEELRLGYHSGTCTCAPLRRCPTRSSSPGSMTTLPSPLFRWLSIQIKKTGVSKHRIFFQLLSICLFRLISPSRTDLDGISTGR